MSFKAVGSGLPGIAATERSGFTLPSPDQPAEVSPYASAGNLQRLDTIVKTGDSLSRAVDVCSRDQLRALAERLGLASHGSTMVLRIQVKRRLLGAGGLVRESRAK